MTTLRIYSLLLLLGIVGCTVTNPMQTDSFKYLYDFESREMHPEYVIYHHKDDSSTVFFRIQSGELLYNRSNSMAPFVCRLKIKATISSTTGIKTDTLALNVTDAAKEHPGWLLGSMKIPMKEGAWLVLMEFDDLNKNNSQSSYVLADKSSRYVAQNYLLTHRTSGEPVFGGFTSVGDAVAISSERNIASPAPVLLRLAGENKLPPPPFSTSRPELPTFVGSTEGTYETDGPSKWHLNVENGNSFFTHDPERKSGLTIKTSNTYYPDVQTVDALKWPLRYITTKNEHEEIVKNNYPKKRIDKFWIDCAGTKDHARELIKTYYSRVEEANYYFSSYTEGWRTDRGMIHMIFGNPTRIDKGANSETWQYGEEGSAGLLSFVFRKVDSPFSNNVYILDRDPGYKQYWEKMIQTWRSGRVYSE